MEPQPTVDDIAAALRRIADRDAIVDLLHEYARRVDLLDLDGVAELFADTCIADFSPSLGGALHGREAIVAVMRRALGRYSHTCHHMGNIQVRFTGPDTAESRSYLLAWHRPRRGGADRVLHGQYRDVLLRTAEGWRIAERREYALGDVGMGVDWHWVERRAPHAEAGRRQEMTRSLPDQ